jgi:Tfp pilus assembly protein PilO
MTGWQRSLGEHRRLALGMAVVAVLNVAVYFLAVRPLAFRVATIEDRDRQAEQMLVAAKAESQAVSGALTGKERAIKELAAFYQTVLPKDLAGARRLTHLRLAQHARESGLKFERFSFDPEPVKGSDLTRVKGEMVLTGTYGEVRKFVHKVETSKDFVVLDDLSLAEGTATGTELVVTLKLSTYFRTAVS